jgi:hypothetical protein
VTSDAPALLPAASLPAAAPAAAAAAPDSASEQVAELSTSTTVATPTSTFSRLHDVEVQLVMQLLDRRSRLALARCSRRTLHAARQPFAWQGGNEPFTLLLVDGSFNISPAQLLGSLLRFAPVQLTLTDLAKRSSPPRLWWSSRLSTSHPFSWTFCLTSAA